MVNGMVKIIPAVRSLFIAFFSIFIDLLLFPISIISQSQLFPILEKRAPRKSDYAEIGTPSICISLRPVIWPFLP